MRVERYHGCPQEAMWVRQTVFVEEQGFRDEFDQIDNRAEHFVLFDKEKPIAVCRVFESEKSKIYILGRLAVLKAYRGKGIGRFLVAQAETYLREIGAKELHLHSQCRASQFYSRIGFTEYGDVEPEEGCPHIWMKKTL